MILECPSCHARFKVAESAIPEAGRTVRCSKCAHEWHVERAALLPDAPVVVHVDTPKAVEPTPVIAEHVPMEDDISPEAKAEGEAFLSQLEAAINATEEQMEHHTPQQAQVKRTAAPANRIRLPFDAKWVKRAVPAIAALWLILAFITYFPSWEKAPVLGGIYHAFGISSTQGLVFADITMEREHVEGGKTKFILAGSIKNNSNADRAVPTVRVALRDGKGNTIWGRSYLDPKAEELKAGEVYPFRITNVETMFASNVKVIKVDMGNSLQLMVR